MSSCHDGGTYEDLQTQPPVLADSSILFGHEIQLLCNETAPHVSDGGKNTIGNMHHRPRDGNPSWDFEFVIGKDWLKKRDSDFEFGTIDRYSGVVRRGSVRTLPMKRTHAGSTSSHRSKRSKPASENQKSRQVFEIPNFLV